MLETIARYDNPHIRGKTGLRDYDAMEKSAYCANTNCLGAFRSLIEKADAKHILVSYNNEGLLSQDEIMSVLLLRGAPCSNTSIDYRWFKSNSRRETPATANGVRELLFYVKVVTAPKKNQPQPVPKRRYDPRNKLNDLSGGEWTYFLKSVELEGDDHNVGKLNDLSEAEWTVALAPVWDTHYPTKGPESYGHRIRKQHPSPKSSQLMKRLIEFFTKKGERVLDPFVEVGGTLLACAMTGRYGVGIDLSQAYLDLYHQTSAELGLEPQPVFSGDARQLGEILRNEPPFDMVLTNPPYSNMFSRKRTGEQKKKTGDDSATPFTESSDDLGNMPPSQFYDTLREVVQAAMDYLKPKGYVVLFCKGLQPTETHHNMIHANLVNALADVGNLRFRGYKIWYNKSLKLYPFGYPYDYVSNQLHQFILIFRKLCDPKSRSSGER